MLAENKDLTHLALKMTIRNLKHTELTEIVDCLIASFADYFVQMPAAVTYWESRFAGARVNYALSYGAFDEGKLAGFMMHGIDTREGELLAFNTGTGVLPAYRGKQLVDSLYAFALPQLKAAGIKKCALEVIRKNEKAIRVYERIGFQKSRKYHCFKGKLKPLSADINIREIPFGEIENKNNPHHALYAWDNCNSAINALKSVYKAYKVTEATTKDVGFFVIQPLSGYLPQFELDQPSEKENWQKLFAGISSVNNTLKINNVDSRREELIRMLPEFGLENHVDQYEMEMGIG